MASAGTDCAMAGAARLIARTSSTARMLVNFFMRKKLKAIEMVESLKSVE